MAENRNISAKENLVSEQAVIAGITFEEYLAKYAEEFHEFAMGTVSKKHNVTLRHQNVLSYLRISLEVYLKLKPIGLAISAPFVMSIPATNSAYEPDIQVVLKDNPYMLHDTFMEGPADICIEIVSPESISRDHGEKFAEYEKGGVGEYWIIDPIHEECRFYRLNSASIYEPQSQNEAGEYITPRLPQLRLHIATLWDDNLPDPITIADAVRGMVESAG